jgi:diacylglycerol kinase (ATP)
VKLWSADEEKEEEPTADSSMQDQMMEVVGVNGVVHLGQLQVGLSKAVKICQCREAVITTGRDLPMQVDGEPWGQAKGTIKIVCKAEPVGAWAQPLYAAPSRSV